MAPTLLWLGQGVARADRAWEGQPAKASLGDLVLTQWVSQEASLFWDFQGLHVALTESGPGEE